MTVEFKMEYPCGHKVYEKIGFIEAVLGRFEFDMRWGCPLHGTTCPEHDKQHTSERIK